MNQKINDVPTGRLKPKPVVIPGKRQIGQKTVRVTLPKQIKIDMFNERIIDDHGIIVILKTGGQTREIRDQPKARNKREDTIFALISPEST